MTATLSRFISASNFVKLMQAQDASGKHGHYLSSEATDWLKVADYVSKNTHTGLPPFVLIINLPIKWLQYEHMPDRPELVQKYAQQSPAFPPIYVSFSSFAAQGTLARPQIKNGNHRVAAALCKGENTINAIMSQESWDNIQQQGFHLSHRQNPYATCHECGGYTDGYDCWD